MQCEIFYARAIRSLMTDRSLCQHLSASHASILRTALYDMATMNGSTCDRISRLQRWHGNQKKALAKRGGSKQLAPLRLDTTKPQPACPSEQRQCVPRRRGSERQGSTYGPEACYHAHESPREVSE